jgi:hypothetical protein
MALIVTGTAWAGLFDLGTAQSQAPVATNTTTTQPVIHKKKHKKPVAAVTAVPPQGQVSPNGSPAVTAVSAAAAVSAVKAVAALAPAPVRTALDEAVMETNALSPLLNVPSPQPSPEKGEGEALPSPFSGEGMPAATDSSLMRASPRSSWGGRRPDEGILRGLSLLAGAAPNT